MALGVAYKQESKFEKEVVGIEDVLKVLNTKVEFGDVAKAYGNECWKNKFLEIFCIIASDAGNTLTAGLLHGMSYVNSIAAAAGGITGLGYASWHINKSAKKDDKKPSALEVITAALSAEVGCVTGTNLVTSGMAFSLAGGYDFFSPESLGIRGVSWLLSWPVGTAAMSAMTLAQKSEAGRLIADAGKTKDIKRLLYEDLRKIGFGESVDTKAYVDLNGDGNKVILHSGNSRMGIIEKKLPQIYARDHDPKTNSLYLVKSPIARYFPEEKGILTSFAKESFGRIGYKPRVVKNPFSHEHSHTHAHT